uniref:Bifunctional cytochrome P450/NADPH--P450 reductase n=1 Tax=Fusarium oxysporum (strain Fo5176) TaxID=660025 RepID=A0A0D2YKI3_FUSOF
MRQKFRSEDSLQDLDRLHDTYGEIYRLRFPKVGSCVIVGSQKLVNELCDEKRFRKAIQAELAEIRLAAGDGLFTAREGEVSWDIAHRVLMPVFGPTAIRSMFDEMYDVVSQMTLKWARYGPTSPISASEDFTRLALDTIALCSMGYRFNSFYKDTTHPFVQSMSDSLVELGNRSLRPSWARIFYRSSERKLAKDINFMRTTSEDLIKARKADPNADQRKDLLAAMMNGVDPRTGSRMDDESIINNLLTFLIAGHETTSGTLSFAFYSMLKNPDAYLKAQQEVDSIMGRDPITVDKLFQLKYVPAVLRETLRQCSPIPGITLEAREDTLLDGKYHIRKGEAVAAIFSKSHLDPLVYGADAKEFKPERMMDENFDRLQQEFPNCWKPFGNGVRACIGRAFAWQEMLLATSMLLQNFDFYLDDPLYKLKIAETLTIKPKDFLMGASLRHNMTPLDLESHLRGTNNKQGIPAAHSQSPPSTIKASIAATPISIYYGSNSGTCEILARRLASNASSHGFSVMVIDTLDTARNRLPQDHPVVIFVASYEGQPPDNAAHFVNWIQSMTGNEVQKVHYVVFGVGNSEWRQTFHRIPKLIDDELGKRGGERLVTLGLTNVAEKDPFLDFEIWESKELWPALEKKYPDVTGGTPEALVGSMGLSVDISVSRASALRKSVKEAIVTGVRDLAAPGLPRKRHIEMKLPSGCSYEVGDYLEVLPMNPRDAVTRALRRFKLPWDAVLTIAGSEITSLPIGIPVSAWDVLSSYVELAFLSTRKDTLVLASYAQSEKVRTEIELLASDVKFKSEIEDKRVSILDLLERFPSVELPIATYLGMLQPIRTRQYSISSSPLKDPSHATLTYSVLETPSLSGQGLYMGVASNFLASLKPDDRLQVSIRRSNIAFHLPLAPDTTPIICVAAGAGLAPFRGFIQQRSIQMKADRILAPALLIFGCRRRDDDLYREEFDAWEGEGAVVVKRAYSRDAKLTAGCKYVQDRVIEQQEYIRKLWNQGGNVYVCGSRQVGDAVEGALGSILSGVQGGDREDGKRFLDNFRNKRFVMDIFS